MRENINKNRSLRVLNFNDKKEYHQQTNFFYNVYVYFLWLLVAQVYIENEALVPFQYHL